MKKVIIIGGGPAGMMAAIQSASCGCDVTIVEKNEKLGKKLFITGKGRCNLTNACDISDLFSNVISYPKIPDRNLNQLHRNEHRKRPFRTTLSDDT